MALAGWTDICTFKGVSCKIWSEFKGDPEKWGTYYITRETTNCCPLHSEPQVLIMFLAHFAVELSAPLVGCIVTGQWPHHHGGPGSDLSLCVQSNNMINVSLIWWIAGEFILVHIGSLKPELQKTRLPPEGKTEETHGPEGLPAEVTVCCVFTGSVSHLCSSCFMVAVIWLVFSSRRLIILFFFFISSSDDWQARISGWHENNNYNSSAANTRWQRSYPWYFGLTFTKWN